MYASCLFCHGALGRNEVLAPFPVGRRLAYDGARGRLWVVCPRCARWNLTPLDERWEAVEEAERLFRGARVRAATDEVALARVPGGLDLVRVGRAERRELTAWRYGRELGRRLLRTAGLVAGGSAAVVGAAASGVVPALALRPEYFVLLHPLMAFAGLQFSGLGLSLRPIRVPGPDGRAYEVFRSEFDRLHLTHDEGGWGVRVKHGHGVLHATGADAVALLRPLLAAINRRGALRGGAEAAAAWVEARGGAASAVQALARESADHVAWFERERREVESNARVERGDYVNRGVVSNPGALHRLPRVERLGLEIAMVEDAERRAMEEELAPLVAAWRDAEAIASVADGLALPPGVEERHDALRAARARDAGGGA